MTIKYASLKNKRTEINSSQIMRNHDFRKKENNESQKIRRKRLLGTSNMNYSEMSTFITWSHQVSFLFANQFSLSQLSYQVPSRWPFSQRPSFEMHLLWLKILYHLIPMVGNKIFRYLHSMKQWRKLIFFGVLWHHWLHPLLASFYLTFGLLWL